MISFLRCLDRKIPENDVLRNGFLRHGLLRNIIPWYHRMDPQEYYSFFRQKVHVGKRLQLVLCVLLGDRSSHRLRSVPQGV